MFTWSLRSRHFTMKYALISIVKSRSSIFKISKLSSPICTLEKYLENGKKRMKAPLKVGSQVGWGVGWTCCNWLGCRTSPRLNKTFFEREILSLCFDSMTVIKLIKQFLPYSIIQLFQFNYCYCWNAERCFDRAKPFNESGIIASTYC